MEQTQKLKKYDFDKALKSGYSKSQIVNSLRNDYNTNLDWEKINEDLKELKPKERDEALFDSLYNNQEIWGISGIKIKEQPKGLQNRILSDNQIQDIGKEVQNMPQWAIESSLKPQILREKIGVDGFWKMFQNKEEIARENALKSALDKGITQKLEKGEDLSVGEILRYYNANDMQKHFTPQSHYKEQQELKKIAQTDFENLDESQKRELQKQNLITRLWNSPKELHDKLKDEVTKKEADEHTKARAEQLERDIIFIQRTYENILKSGADYLRGSTEQRDKYREMLQESAMSLGFDGIGFKGDRIYAFKDDKAIFIDDGFFKNLGQILGTNAFDIAGSITGAIAGAKRGTGKIGKLAGAIAGGAVGAGAGGIADSIIAQYNSRGEVNLADALLTGAESATFDIAGGLIVSGGAKAVKGAVKGTQNLLRWNPFSIPTSAVINSIGSENIQAAKEIVEQTFTQEQKDDILAFSKSFGGNLELQDKDTFLTKSAEFLTQKYGADSKIAKVANALENYSKAHNKAQAREDILTLIRADEKGQSLGILLEVAKNSTLANQNLREILNATSYKLKKEIESLGLKENAFKKVFNDFQKGTQEDYDEAFNKILGELYAGEKIVLDGEAYAKFREEMGDLILLDPQGMQFLNFVEKGIYNPNGVDFTQLSNARKLLNSYRKSATNPSTKDFIKNAIESTIRKDIDKGVNQIFLSRPEQFEKAKKLYDTALSDYSAMLETLKTLDKLKFNKLSKTNAELMDNLINFIQGSGGLKEVDNYAMLTKGLKKEQVESLELNALNRIYEKNLLKDSKDSTFEVFNSAKFLEDTAKLREIFQSEGAQKFVEIMQGFNRLFGNDATIALKLGFANPPKEGSSIAQSVEGAINQKIVKGIFGILMRNLPTNNKIIEKFGFKEKVQKMALAHHIEQALKSAYSINDFTFALKKISDDPSTPSPTRQAIIEFIKDLTRLVEDTREKADIDKTAQALKEQDKNTSLRDTIQILKDRRRQELQRAIQEKMAKEAQESQILKEAQQEKQRIKDAQVGKAINEVDLNLQGAIQARALKPTRINLENKSYSAQFVIINKEDLKPNFETKGTQGRTQKQENVIQDIQENLNPNKLFFSEGGFEGLPIILKDGQVSVGNHRAQALKNLSQESLASYQKSAKEVFGVDLKENELIVRMLDERIPNEEILNLSFASNVGREQNLSEKALSTLGKYQENLDKLPQNIYAQNVEEMQQIVAKSLDKTNNGLNTFDTNFALFTSLAKNKDKNILDALNAISGDAEQKAKVVKMFAENAGNFHNLAKQTQMPNLDLRDYLTQALYFTAKANDSRVENFKELAQEIKSIIQTTDAQGKNALIQEESHYNELIGKALGYSFARFRGLENPSGSFFDFLSNIKLALSEELEPTLFSAGRPLSSADIYDFLSVSIKSGIPSDETSEVLELLPQLKAKHEAIKEANQSTTPAHLQKQSEVSVTKAGDPHSQIHKTQNLADSNEVIPQTKNHEQTITDLQNVIKEAEQKQPYKAQIKPILESLQQEWAKDKDRIVLHWKERVKGKSVKRTPNLKSEDNIRNTLEVYKDYKDEDASREINMLQNALDSIEAEKNKAKQSKKDIEAEIQDLQAKLQEQIAKANNLDIFTDITHQRLKLYSNKYKNDNAYINKLLKEGFNADDMLNDIKSVRESIQNTYNLSPLKDFGTNYAEYYHDGQGAIKKILAEAKDYEARKRAGELTESEAKQGTYKGQVSGAFYRKDLEELSGNGNIDLVWGDEKAGLAHILARRKEDFINQGFNARKAEQEALEFVQTLPEIIAKGKIEKGSNRIFLNTDDKRAVIALDFKGEQNKWIITAYQKELKANVSAYPHQNTQSLNTSSPIVEKPLNSTDIIPQSTKEAIDPANRFAESFSNELFSALPKAKQAQYQSLQKQAGVLYNKYHQAKGIEAKRAYEKQHNAMLDKIYDFEQKYPVRVPSTQVQVRGNTMPTYKPDEIIDVEIIAQEPSIQKQITYKRHNLRAKAIQSLQVKLEALKPYPQKQIEYKKLESQINTLVEKQHKELQQPSLFSEEDLGVRGELEAMNQEDYLKTSGNLHTQHNAQENIRGFIRDQRTRIQKSEQAIKEIEALGDETLLPTITSLKKEIKNIRENIAQMREFDDLLPLKEFGENYIEYYLEGAEAITKILQEKQGQVAGAFYREDLGAINVVWGDSSFGLKHILEKHADDFKTFGKGANGVAQGIDEIVQNGKLVSKNGINTIWHKGKNGEYYKLGLSKGFKGKDENQWIITAYEAAREKDKTFGDALFTDKQPLSNLDNAIIPQNDFGKNPQNSIIQKTTKGEEYGTADSNKSGEISTGDNQLARIRNDDFKQNQGEIQLEGRNRKQGEANRQHTQTIPQKSTKQDSSGGGMGGKPSISSNRSGGLQENPRSNRLGQNRNPRSRECLFVANGKRGVGSTKSTSRGFGNATENLRVSDRLTDNIQSTDNPQGLLSPAQKAEINQRYKPAEIIETGNAKQIVKHNLKAIQTLAELLENNALATNEQKDLLHNFRGFGKASNEMLEIMRNPQNKTAQEFKAALQKINEIAGTKLDLIQIIRTFQDSYYTPQPIVRQMVGLLKDRIANLPSFNVLEPSVGVGRFLGELPSNANIYAVERDELSALLAKNIYPHAKVETSDFQKSNIANIENAFDLVIGNPPYSSTILRDKKGISGTAHNYFLQKSIKSLRPNGISIQIVTHNFLDSNNSKYRELISKEAKFLGAVRLPSGTFKDTEVVTDIVAFRKLNDGESAEDLWVKSSKINENVFINDYFKHNPHHILGETKVIKNQFGNETLQVSNPSFDIYSFDLSKYIPLDEQSLKGYTLGDEIIKPTENVSTQRAVGEVTIQNGKFYKYLNNKAGSQIEFNPHQMLSEITTWSESTIKKAVENYQNDFPKIQTLKSELENLRYLENSMAEDAEIESARARLNAAYDDLLKGYSFKNESGGFRERFRAFVMLDDTAFELLALEKGILTKEVNGKTKIIGSQKADIFTQRQIYPYKPPLSAQNLNDAVTIAKNETGKIDIQRINTLLERGEDELQKTQEELLNEKFLFLDSKGEIVEKEDFLSGNVKQKLQSFKDESGEVRFSEDEKKAKFQKIAYESLKEVQPIDIDIADVTIPLGANWIPKEIHEQFLQELGMREISLQYEPQIGWLAKGTGHNNNEYIINTSKEFRDATGVKEINALNYIEKMFNNNELLVQRAVTKGETTHTYKDPIATRALQNAKVRLQKEFKSFIVDREDLLQDTQKRFNDLFNAEVPKTYDGSHLSFIGMNRNIHLRPHQKNAVYRILASSNTLLAHAVGTGKTYTLASSVMEANRLGQARKSMIVLPNYLTTQFATESRQLYPNAKIAVVNGINKKLKNRQLEQLKNNQYDLIVTTYTAFKEMDISRDYFQKIINEEVYDAERLLAKLQEEKAPKRQIKGLITRIDNLRQKAILREEKLKKEGVNVFFDDLGLDGLYFDEAHYLKSLPITTRQPNVRGINTRESERAMDALMKIRQMQDFSKKVIFSTGTPVTNYVSDIYIMQKYLSPNKLKERGVERFDDWCSMFAEASTEFELKPTGDYAETTRLRRITNLIELNKMYFDFTDLITKEEMKEAMENMGIKNVEPKVIRKQSVNELSKGQVAYLEEIYHRAEELKRNPEIAFMKGGDNHLKIINDARKASLDLRLVNPNAPRDEKSKVVQCANNIKEIYDRYNEDLGTQLVFLDLSTPKHTLSPARRAKITKEYEQIMESIELGKATSVEEAEKLQAKAQSLGELLEMSSNSFSLYDELKTLLKEKGIKEDEIAFIHDYDAKKGAFSKEALSDKINSGKIRILIGSTGKMGAGCNFQERLVALHHLDLDWTPANMEQREGRIIRQGNKLLEKYGENFEVEIHNYITKNSSDSIMLQTLENKQRIIKQMQDKTLRVREVVDDSEDDIYGKLQALGSENGEEILEMLKLGKNINLITNELESFDTKLKSTTAQLSFAKANIKNLETQKSLLQNLEKMPLESLNIQGKEYLLSGEKTREKFNQALSARVDKFSNSIDNVGEIATIGEYKILAKKDSKYIIFRIGKDLKENVGLFHFEVNNRTTTDYYRRFLKEFKEIAKGETQREIDIKIQSAHATQQRHEKTLKKLNSEDRQNLETKLNAHKARYKELEDIIKAKEIKGNESPNQSNLGAGIIIGGSAGINGNGEEELNPQDFANALILGVFGGEVSDSMLKKIKNNPRAMETIQRISKYKERIKNGKSNLGDNGNIPQTTLKASLESKKAQRRAELESKIAKRGF